MEEEKRCFVDFVENRQYTIPKEAIVEVTISKEDQEKIKSWGDKEFWASTQIELYLGPRSVVILNKDLAVNKH